MQEILEPLAKPRLPVIPEDRILKNSIDLSAQDHKKLSDICAAIHGTLLRKKAIGDYAKQIVGSDKEGEEAAGKIFDYLIDHPNVDATELKGLIFDTPDRVGLVNIGSIIGRRAKHGYFDEKRAELLRSCLLYAEDLFKDRTPAQCRLIHSLITGRKPSAGIVFGMLTELGIATIERENIKLGGIQESQETRTVAIEIRASAWERVKIMHFSLNIPNYALVAGLLRLSGNRYELRDMILETFTCPLAVLKKSKAAR